MYTRDEIREQTAAFIEKGGKIKTIPIGVITATEDSKLGIGAEVSRARGNALITGRKGTRNTKQQFHLSGD